jgi:tetratricopeptide (TPR) repeat protein
MPRQKSTHVDSPAAVGERLKARARRPGSASASSPSRLLARVHLAHRVGRPHPLLQLLRELGRRLSVTEDYLATAPRASEDERGSVEAEVLLRLNELDDGESDTLDASSRAQQRLPAEALAGLGHVEFRRGGRATAIERLREALAASPQDESHHPDLADNLGRAYAMVGELESAIGVFERCRESAARQDANLRDIQFDVLLAHALIDSGNLGRARGAARERARLGKNAESPSVRAQLYWSQSRLHDERDDPRRRHATRAARSRSSA